MGFGNLMGEMDDDEPFTFQPLGLAAARVVASIEKPEQNEEDDRSSDAERYSQEEEKRREHRKYVDKRLAELAEFERRAAGIVIIKRRR